MPRVAGSSGWSGAGRTGSFVRTTYTPSRNHTLKNVKRVRVTPQATNVVKLHTLFPGSPGRRSPAFDIPRPFTISPIDPTYDPRPDLTSEWIIACPVARRPPPKLYSCILGQCLGRPGRVPGVLTEAFPRTQGGLGG